MQHKDKLSDADRIARRKEATARYREKNREKCRAATLKSNAINPERKRAYDAEWKATNADYIQAQKEYRDANRDKLNAQTVAWQKANQEHFNAYQRQYAIKNSESAKARIKRWRQNNPERAAYYSKQWAKENADLRRLLAGARRARVRKQSGSVSKNIVQKLMKLQRGKCAICGIRIKARNHLDHVMPLALGGLHDDSNLQLLCPACNLSKHAQHPIDYMQKKGFLL